MEKPNKTYLQYILELRWNFIYDKEINVILHILYLHFFSFEYIDPMDAIKHGIALSHNRQQHCVDRRERLRWCSAYNSKYFLSWPNL